MRLRRGSSSYPTALDFQRCIVSLRWSADAGSAMTIVRIEVRTMGGYNGSSRRQCAGRFRVIQRSLGPRSGGGKGRATTFPGRMLRRTFMPLEAIGPMMRRAIEGGYAVGYFESWNLESLQGVVDAAEETRSPVIIGFNGDFLSRTTRLAAERLDWYAALGRVAAESAAVPCGLIFNECPRDEWVRGAIEGGFNLVMLADPEAPADDYTRRVAELARLAHARGVAIEAELGELP